MERIKGLNLVLHEDEVYLVSDPRDPWMINAPVYDQFKARSRTTLENAIVVHDRARFRVVFSSMGRYSCTSTACPHRSRSVAENFKGPHL